MITKSFTYAGITFDPYKVRSGYKATAMIVPQQEVEQLILKLVGEDGLESYKAYLGSTVIQVQGEIRGKSERDLNNKIENLQMALNPHHLESDPVYKDGFLPFEFQEGEGKSSRYYAKIFRRMPIIQQLSSRHIARQTFGAELIRNFQFLLFCKDPNKYTTSINSVTINISADPSGSSALPKAIPFPIASSVGTGQTTVSNSSTYLDAPLEDIVIYGPGSAFEFVNSTSGEKFTFTTDVSLTSSEKIETDFAHFTAYKVSSTGEKTSIIAYVTSDSKCWKIKPGNNTVRFEGLSMEAETTKITFKYKVPV